MTRFLIKFYPTLLLMGIIAFLSLASFSSVSDMPKLPHMDKLVHFCMYMAMSYVLLFDLSRTHPLQKVRCREMLIAFITATLTGGLMELMQGTLTATRSADWWDMLANTCGALSGVLLGLLTLPAILKLLYRKRYRRSGKC